MFSSRFFCNIKNHGVQNHPQKTNIKWDCFVYGCPSLFNLFHFFDIFIKIFFDAITDHHCFFFFSLFFLSHGNHRLLSYKSSHTMLTYTFIYLQFFCLFLWSLFHLWTVWWCSVHLERFWYIYNLLLHWQYSYQSKYYNQKTLFSSCNNII